MQVKNIDGTSDKNCSCGSWLDHWKKYSGKDSPTYCSESKCMETDLVGAHVQKYASTDNSWYIVPLCKKHNAKAEGPITLIDSAILVSANKAETCEKKVTPPRI